MSPDEIKSARVAMRMTQAEFAAASGSDIRTVQRWESGDRKPRGSAMMLITRLIHERQPKGSK